MFLLCRIDPKWGGPWQNFQLGVYLLGITTAVETVAFLVVGLVAGRRTLILWRSKVVAALTMAAATIALWPPKARSPIVVACLVSAIALFAAAVTTWLSARSGGTRPEKKHAVIEQPGR
jgi:hypothetical protein